MPPVSATPTWVVLALRDALSAADVCARATRLGIAASTTSDGRIQLPNGFLAWIDPRPFPGPLLDTSASEARLGLGAVCLHVSGGNNELAVQAHTQPAAMAAMTRRLRDQLSLVTTPPGDKPRIVSAAALKVERLTELLRGLATLADSVVFPRANGVGFSASEFLAESQGYDSSGYHFPLYVFSKVRSEDDGPYICTTGMFLFALPDIAMPLGANLAPQAAVNAVGALQREMVAEGWWPEHGATFDTPLGPVQIEHVGGALFVVPTAIALDAAKVAAARYRYAREQSAATLAELGILHRVRRPGLMVDHHLRAGGASFAVTNGVALEVQRGGTPTQENDRVELMITSRQVGPWATGWLEWATAALRGHDGSNPLKPFDRVVLEAPFAGIAGCVLWPQREPFSFPGLGAVHTWSLVPILEDELAQFRANPGAQAAWLEARFASGDLETMHARWSRAVR
jgi:hypothetical protein